MPKGNRTNPPRIPRTYKENFWSRKRVEANCTLKEIATAIGRAEKLVGMWFTGQYMPRDGVVRDICNLFDVDFNEGQLAFQKAHLEWKAEHKTETKYSGVNKSKKTKKCEVKEGELEISNIAEVVLALYGKISCEAFLTVYNAITSGKPNDCDIEQLIYGKVDFKTYQQIITIMKS